MRLFVLLLAMPLGTFLLGVSSSARVARAQDESWSAEELVAAIASRVTSVDSLYCEYNVEYDEKAKIHCRFARSDAILFSVR